jgi:hypothetical protein
MASQTEFFTRESAATLAGATFIVVVVCNGLQKAFNVNPRWLALVISQIIALTTVAISPNPAWFDYGFGFINGFLIHSTASGATKVGAQATGAEKPVTASEQSFSDRARAPRRRFFSPWS